MGRKKSESPHPVTIYARHLFAEYKANVGPFSELAKKLKIAPSMVNAINNMSGVTLETMPAIARVFGFKNEAELVTMAAAFVKTGEAPPRNPELARQTEAVELAQAYGVTAEQVSRVLARFPLEEFGHQDTLWWLTQMHAERSADAQRKGAEKAAAHVQEKAAERVKNYHDDVQRTAAERPKAEKAPKSRRKVG